MRYFQTLINSCRFQNPNTFNMPWYPSVQTAWFKMWTLYQQWTLKHCAHVERVICHVQELHCGMVQWEARMPTLSNAQYTFKFSLFVPFWFLSSNCSIMTAHCGKAKHLRRRKPKERNKSKEHTQAFWVTTSDSNIWYKNGICFGFGQFEVRSSSN